MAIVDGDGSRGPAGLPVTRAEAVAGELRRLIQSGELPPGTRLRQLEIARRLGVSTTPVREALSALALEGLVRQDAHRGAVVFLPSLKELNENYEIRVELEPLATRLAAALLTDEDLAALDELLERMRDAPGPHAYVALNTTFHSRIYAAARRPRLFELIERLRAAGAGYMTLMEDEDDPAYASQVQAEHDGIVAALRAQDGRRASRLMAEHLRQSAAHMARRVVRHQGSRSAGA